MNFTVLIVDDSKLARMSVTKSLTTLYPEWNSVEASNAVDALKLLQESSPDIVLLDFNMPGRDGLDLAADFRRMQPLIPIAVISANHQQEIIDRARAVGASFLPKPLTQTALGEFLNAAIAQIAKSE